MNQVARLLGYAWRNQRRVQNAASAGQQREASASMPLHFPSPWLGAYESEAQFRQDQAAIQSLTGVCAYIDDQMLASRHPRRFPAYCAACGTVRTIEINWRLVGVEPDGSVHPAWTETGTCECCGLNSRMRALVAFILDHPDYDAGSRCYLAERVTVSYPVFAHAFGLLECSEFLGPGRKPGEQVFVPAVAGHVRHEDLTRLSFPDNSFDWVVTQDVFEHVPDYRAAFRECARVLSPGGHLVFTVPFSSVLSQTRVRATLKADGSVEHLLPPEVHGNPLSGEGSLCFQNFGWDILDDLRAAGFETAQAHAYWGPWQGHVGVGGHVFCATLGA